MAQDPERTNIIRLQVLDHFCFHADDCSDIVVHKAEKGTAGVVRKLYLTNGQSSRFIPNIERAQEWAKRFGLTIPEEDIEKCRQLIS